MFAGANDDRRSTSTTKDCLGPHCVEAGIAIGLLSSHGMAAFILSAFLLGPTGAFLHVLLEAIYGRLRKITTGVPTKIALGRRFTGFDDKIVAMYARGMTVREIQGFLV